MALGRGLWWVSSAITCIVLCACEVSATCGHIQQFQDVFIDCAMVHVLVKWPGTRLFDVYPLRCVVESRCERQLTEDMRNVAEFAGHLILASVSCVVRLFRVSGLHFSCKKEPSPGYILAAGPQRDMEKKRDRYAKAM
uniref:Putative secretory protein n=1 Tax=Argas monolakensis TaxID=34602 RepID=Q09JK9_ARGMO|nr:putative secretory protein [Argas monolakensis]